MRLLIVVFSLSLCACAPAKPILGLHQAVTMGILTELEAHIHWKSDLNAKDHANAQALHLALLHENYQAAELLLQQAVDVDGLDVTYTTPLHIVCRAGKLAWVEKLVALGAPLEQLDMHGSSPMHLAARAGHADVVAFLISKGADVNLRDPEGPSVLEFASGRPSMRALLLKHGAKEDLMSISRQMLRHSEAMIDLMGRDPKDCQGALSAAEKYLNDNDSDLKRLRARIESDLKSMPPEHGQAYENHMQQRVEVLLMRKIRIVNAFGIHCPLVVQQIGSMIGGTPAK
jgi:hypothetical protein